MRESICNKWTISSFRVLAIIECTYATCVSQLVAPPLRECLELLPSPVPRDPVNVRRSGSFQVISPPDIFVMILVL